MPTSSINWIYFGNFPQIDTDETNYTNEDPGAVNTTVSYTGLQLVTVTGDDADNSGIITSDDAGQTAETFTYDLGAGPVTATYDAESLVNVVVTQLNGTQTTSVVTLYQMTNGDTFLFDSNNFDFLKIASIQILGQVSDNYNGTQAPLTVDPPIDNARFVCFAAGTLIATPGGDRPVETLRPGDPVLTHDRGAQPLAWTGRRRLSPADLGANPALCPVRVAAGALGNGLPRRDLTVSPHHRMLVTGPAVQRLFSHPDILVPAKTLVGLPGITRLPPAGGADYVHILFDRHAIVLSEGAPTESLYPGSEALTMVGPEGRSQILTLFPGLVQAPWPFARPVAPPRDARRLARHLAPARRAEPVPA
jgi:hypothetical protein